MAETRSRNVITIVTALISASATIIASLISINLKKEVDTLRTITQEVKVNVVATLGENAQGEITASTDLATTTEELITAYKKAVDENERLENEYATNQTTLTSKLSDLESKNKALENQVQNLKAVLLDTYTMEQIDTVVDQGFLERTFTKRLDNLECLDSERCEKVSSVKDLYGTTHSISYKFDAGSTAWAKFKLDGSYDTFTADIVTSDATSRNANMSVEIYVDDVLVSRVDDIVRDEHIRSISANVNGGKVLLIKAIRTNNQSDSVCYITDTALNVLQ